MPDMPSESVGNFELVKKVKLDFTDVTVSKWRSKASGLRVIHLDYDAPIVKGYFVVATEIFNDSGCPHTLEHLVFLGSDKYPYKGVLDNLANRAFAAGTNAWTGDDHTAYTISTAGEQGFLQFLPIYVDHILYPTITDAGFVTEVHHINTEAEDAGVVYSEMQGRENTSGDLMALSAQRLFYPKESAYRSETGGLMEALRVLTAEQIRQYHGTYYVPHNLCLIIAGKLSTKTLLEKVQSDVEPSIVKHGQAKGVRPPGWKRPFMETPSANKFSFTDDKKQTIEFPEKDESVGEVSIGFIGPDPSDFLARKAIDILGVYLTDSPVSPLNKEYVEIPSPLCTYIGFYENSRASFVALDVHLGSVPTEHLETIDIKLKDSLDRIAREGFDMDRMKTVIQRDRLKLFNELESNGGDAFTNTIISHFLYGQEDGSDLGPSLAEIERFDALTKWTSQQWSDLLRKYYIDAKSVVIRGRPSASLADRLETDEKARIAKQREELGEEGLKKLEQELESAKQEHEQPIPEKVLTDFPVPDVGNISWIPVQSANNKEGGKALAKSAALDLERHLQKDKTDLPFFVQFDHVQSDFVEISMYLSTSDLPPKLRPYVNVYLSSFFSLPVTRADGTKLSHEDVVKQLDEDTVAYEIGLGNSWLSFNELLNINIKAEVSKYEGAIAWLRDLLYSADFDEERLKVTVAKIQQSIPELKRDGNNVVSSVSGSLLNTGDSTLQSAGIITQMDFNPALSKALEQDPAEVIKNFREFRRIITNPKGIRFSIRGNILSLQQPQSAWQKNFVSLPKTELAPIPWSKDVLTELGKNPSKKGVVVSLPTIESSFAVHTTKSISGFEHPDYPALRVACEVLDGTESFLWRYIRGSGLAYGANMSLDLEAGQLGFLLYRAPDSFKAFAEGSKVVHGLVDGSIELKETALDAAKSSLVYALTRQVSTPPRAAHMSFINQVMKGVSQDNGKNLLKGMQAVTIAEVKNALKQYVLPLFNSSSSVAVVVSAPGKCDDITKGLESVGFEVERRSLEVTPEDVDFESGSESGSGSDAASQR